MTPRPRSRAIHFECFAEPSQSKCRKETWPHQSGYHLAQGDGDVRKVSARQPPVVFQRRSNSERKFQRVSPNDVELGHCHRAREGASPSTARAAAYPDKPKLRSVKDQRSTSGASGRVPSSSAGSPGVSDTSNWSSGSESPSPRALM